jgi:hypothetical protein
MIVPLIFSFPRSFVQSSFFSSHTSFFFLFSPYLCLVFILSLPFFSYLLISILRCSLSVFILAQFLMIRSSVISYLKLVYHFCYCFFINSFFNFLLFSFSSVFFSYDYVFIFLRSSFLIIIFYFSSIFFYYFSLSSVIILFFSHHLCSCVISLSLFS